MLLHQKLFLLFLLLLPTQLGKHFWPDWSFVRGLRVDYLSPTVYLTDILIIATLFFWFLEKLKTQNPKLKTTTKNLKLLFFISSIFIFLLTNSLLAQNSGAALYKLVKIIEFSLLGFYIAQNHYSLFTIRYSLIGAVIYSSLIAIAQFLKQSSLNGIFYWLGERTFNAGTPGIAKISLGGRLLMRPYATFPHPNVLAGFTLVVSLLVLPYLFKKHKLFAICYLLFAILTIIISFSRAVWLVGLLVALFLVYRFKRLRVISCGLLIFLPALLLIKLPIFPEEAFIQRMELNKISLQLIKQSPLIGIGLNNFIVRLPEFWRGSTYWLQPVHNIFLLAAAETGLIGLVIFLWFLFLTYRKLLITNYYLLITALSAILALGFFDHYWFTLQQTQVLFAIVLGLSWGSAKIAS